LADDSGILNAEPTLILPATFGGLDAGGMLDDEPIPKAPKPGDPPPPSLDVADHPGYEQHADAKPRLRLVIRRTDEGNWVPEALPGGVSIGDLDLEESYDSSTALFADLRKVGLRIRLVQPVRFDEEGEAVKSLVMLAPVADRTKPQDQSLADHVGAVETEAQRIADRLDLQSPLRQALLFAARWHDEGKKADIWQRFAYGDSGACKGKSSKTRDPKSLRGYRHEFGSLMRIHHPERHSTNCNLPTDTEARVLGLHLIATHHGFGRPHFDNPMDRAFQTKQCEGVHADAIRRFARLQRQYGWWRLAWLENLLRCADALASADDVSEDDVGETNEEGGENS
jgi:CRISPR-associated endonuclease/helicase Cas3